VERLLLVLVLVPGNVVRVVDVADETRLIDLGRERVYDLLDMLVLLVTVLLVLMVVMVLVLVLVLEPRLERLLDPRLERLLLVDRRLDRRLDRLDDHVGGRVDVRGGGFLRKVGEDGYHLYLFLLGPSLLPLRVVLLILVADLLFGTIGELHRRRGGLTASDVLLSPIVEVLMLLRSPLGLLMMLLLGVDAGQFPPPDLG